MPEADIQGRLLPGERIMWTGTLPSGILLQPGDAIRVPFSLMWGGFGNFWEWSGQHMGRAPDFFTLWGIPFVLAGLYLIAGRFFVDAWVQARTSYAVTCQRVLICGRRRPLNSPPIPSTGCRNFPWKSARTAVAPSASSLRFRCGATAVGRAGHPLPIQPSFCRSQMPAEYSIEFRNWARNQAPSVQVGEI